MGIVIVFLSGLIKLWSTNHQMRKLELLDAEKQARVTQMRKSGLSPNGRYRFGSEIPFGVKALEGGVEVDGIWTAKKTSMSSQPPNRKWSSRRKVRAPPRSLVEMNDLGSPNKRARTGSRGSRGSRRGSNISRREIAEPSHVIREKLENLPLPEGTGDVMGDEQARASHPSHKGPLGRIQRSLKKMTSLEVWQDQERKRNAGRVEVKEFREKAQAKKPQRFYPESSTNSSFKPSLVAPKPRSYTAENRLENLLTAHGASQAVGPSTGRYIAKGQATPTAASTRRDQTGFNTTVSKAFTAHPVQTRDPRQRVSSDYRLSSVDSFITSADVSKQPSIPVRVPGPHARRSSEDRRTLQEAPVVPIRRSSRSSEHRLPRQSTEVRRSQELSYEAAQALPAPTLPAARYPPNSSRSAPVVQRSHSSGRQSKQQQQATWTPPSPTFDLDEM